MVETHAAGIGFIFFFYLWVRQAVCDAQLQTEFVSNLGSEKRQKLREAQKVQP